MRPAYDLTDAYQAYQFLQEECKHLHYVPTGMAVHYAGRLTNVLDLARRPTDWRNPPTGDETLAALALLADLRTWLAEAEPNLIAAARKAGVTWEELAPILGVGDRRAAQRRYIRVKAHPNRKVSSHD